MHAMAKVAENRQTAGDLNWMPIVAPWRVAILAKIRQKFSETCCLFSLFCFSWLIYLWYMA